MCKRRFRRELNYHGKRTLKKFKDIVIPFFREKTHAIIRQLTTSDLPGQREIFPDLTYEDLRFRYYEEVSLPSSCEKQRANHVQSWRLKGTHKTLIHGGVYRAPPPGSLPSMPSAADTAEVISSETAPLTPSSTATAPTAAAAAATAPMVDFPEEKNLICCCGVVLKTNTAYPKERWGEDTQVSCVKCWKEKQALMVQEHVTDPSKRKATLQQLDDGTNSVQRKRRKMQTLLRVENAQDFQQQRMPVQQKKHTSLVLSKKKTNPAPEPDNLDLISDVEEFEVGDDEGSTTEDENDEGSTTEDEIDENGIYDPLSGWPTPTSKVSPPPSKTPSAPPSKNYQCATFGGRGQCPPG